MLVFPNAKINIGLNIIERRTDGYHNIETVFYPLNNLYETLEVVDSKEFALHISGITITDNIEQNLITKAYRLMQRDFGLPPQAFYLKKSIQMGAGLGGGSADAAFALKALNSKFDLRLPPDTLREYNIQGGRASEIKILDTRCRNSGCLCGSNCRGGPNKLRNNAGESE